MAALSLRACVGQVFGVLALPIEPVGLTYLSQDAAGIADGYDPGGDITASRPSLSR